MGDVEDLKIVLRAEVDKAVANLKKGAAAGRAAGKDWDGLAKSFTRSAKESLSVKNAFGQLTAQVAGGLAIYSLATRTLQSGANFAKESTTAYEKQAQAVAKLNAVLAATGGSVGLSTYELQSYASELQAMTTIGDESIIEMQGVLATFKSIQGQTFKEATARVLDMSAAFGGDLTSSAKQLGKALEDPIKGVSSLGEVGITFTAAEKKMVASLVEAGRVADAQGILLDKLEGKIGGVAAALAGDAVGAAKQFANAWGDRKELIGQSITDSLEPAYRFLTKFITATNEATAAKRNLDAVTQSGGKKGDSEGAIGDLDGAIEKLKPRLEKAQGLLDDANRLLKQGVMVDTSTAMLMVADYEKQIAELEKKRTEIIDIRRREGIRSASVAAATKAEREAAAAQAEREAADDAALTLYREVDAELKKRVTTMEVQAGVTGTQVEKQALLNAYTDAYVKLITESNGSISKANPLAKQYADVIADLNTEIKQAAEGTHYSPLGDMDDAQRIYQLYTQTAAGSRAAKQETIAWVEAQRSLTESSGESLVIYDAILADLRGIEESATGQRKSLLGFDNLHEVKEALEELEADLLGLFDRASMAQGLSDAFASIGESLAEGGTAMEGLGRYIQQAASAMLRQVSTFAFTAGLHVLADGGLAALPLALGLFALAGISGILGGALGSGSGTSSAVELTYDPVLQAEKELRDQRLELLRETIAEEKKLREEAIDKLGESFDAEYEVLRDLWNRNLVSTEQFKSQSGALRSSRDEAIDEANQPTSAEQEQARLEQEKAAMATLRQELYYRLDAGIRTYDAIKGFKASTFKNDLIAAGNKITGAETLQELQMIAAEFTRVSSSMTSKYGVAAFAQGGDFVTSGPQLIMVGDNPGGRERVTVEPISSPNLYGPSSGGVTIQIIGDVYGIEDLYSRLAATGRQMMRQGRATTGVFA